MAGPPAAVAAVRVAVRRQLADLPSGALVLVACSGGADSLALAAALAFVAPRAGLAAGLLTVDHGWDRRSAERAAAVAARGRTLGLHPAEVLPAPARWSEGAARDARRSALSAAADRLGAAAVLLGHTRDDQAETVLLRLARGSGARSLAGMPRRDGLLRRPLLDLPRTTTREACADLGLRPWEDPTNADPAFARARVRASVLPALERALGPGAAPALARTADLLRADADALDALAAAAAAEVAHPDGRLRVTGLATLPAALRGRVLHRAARSAGCPPAALSAGHVAALDALVTGWHGQGPVALPGGVVAARAEGTIAWSRAPAPPSDRPGTGETGGS